MFRVVAVRDVHDTVLILSQQVASEPAHMVMTEVPVVLQSYAAELRPGWTVLHILTWIDCHGAVAVCAAAAASSQSADQGP